MRNKKQRGFGVIETVVCLAVLGILILLGLQPLVVWLQNQQLRRSSDDMVDGVQISFGPGTGWTVRKVTSGALIQMQEGLPATTVTFDSLGGVAANADGSPSVTKIDVTHPAAGACQPSGALRCLRDPRKC